MKKRTHSTVVNEIVSKINEKYAGRVRLYKRQVGSFYAPSAIIPLLKAGITDHRKFPRIKIGTVGQCDIYGWVSLPGRDHIKPIEIEVKVGRDRIKPEQKIWGHVCKKWGVFYTVASSVENVVEYLESYGVYG